ncbi:phosphotransferase [Amycolatopsis anabasis]|uniref:phosphotransferase n=1 Tax=Amycolatopsis anabasis TaxID=1840409 RepID=UPI00131E78EE|nr:phosphotransferase [Amycolatopsis anabasis]
MHEVTERTRHWLETVALLGKRPVVERRLSGGYRNENLLLACADGRRYVLRRYLGEARAEVEAALARRVRPVVPVAEVVAAEPGGSALLLEFVPGTAVEELLRELPSHDAESLGITAGRVLAAIGTIRFDRGGFFTDATLVPEPVAGTGDLPGWVRADPGWALTAADRDGLLAAAERGAPLIARIADESRLVHSDFNPKNLLAERSGDGWRVTVLDWEFAFSGSPLADLGNVLRFGDTPFTGGVLAGYGPLPGGWRETARALDLFALADLLTRAPQRPLADAIRTAVDRIVR